MGIACAADDVNIDWPGQQSLDRDVVLQQLAGHGCKEIVFAARTAQEEHWYANIGYYARDPRKKAYGKGGRLCKLELASGNVVKLVDDPEGAIRDPVVHYDGKTILFSWRKAGTENFLLYEIQSDGSGLRQITSGVFDDYEPTYLPDGGISFVSTRCRRWVNCWITQVGNIYRCERDGSQIRHLSPNLEHDNTPWPLPDGRVLYTRWEYIDRSQMDYHHLWTMNPDGTSQMVYFGNMHPGGVFIDAKPIPGTEKVVLIHSPGHGRREHEGQPAILSVANGPDDRGSMRELPLPEEFFVKRGNNPRRGFRDPWAFADSLFMAAYENRLDVFDVSGKGMTLFALPAEWGSGVMLHEPRPIQPRNKESVIPARIDPAKTTGTFLVNNAYFGRNMDGIQPGEIKRLMIVEVLPKPVNFTGGMDPMSYCAGFSLERILGTVPVEVDGSAHFTAPAGRSLFFIALDARNLALKRMQSFTTLQPGETLSCVGCHENRTATPNTVRSTILLAAKRPPSTIEPLVGVNSLPDFSRDVQPILDRHCLTCHDYDKREGNVILTGDRGPVFSHSYFTLKTRGQIADGENRARSNYPPRSLGSGASALMKKIDGSHHDVRVEEREAAQIRAWLDIGALYPGTYAALGCGSIGGYLISQQLNVDKDWPETKAVQSVFARRCASCHTPDKRPLPHSMSDEMGISFWQADLNDPCQQRSRHIVFNLTRPEKSLILLAPLAKSAGGYGVKKTADQGPEKAHPAIFATTADPDYQLLLQHCIAGKRKLDEVKRFDMPGFKPRPEYVREMKRFGVLPAAFDVDKDPIDVYATDRKYWALFECSDNPTSATKP